jgi:hypothetical protein
LESKALAEVWLLPEKAFALVLARGGDLHESARDLPRQVCLDGVGEGHQPGTEDSLV